MVTTEQASGADVYATRIVRALNDGFITLMLSLGHRAGLFDVMATMPASTSRQIARAANLDERYVREWLGALTAGRIVEHEPGTNTYALPLEYAAVLTRDAGANNLASLAQFLPILASAEEMVLASFHTGGGVAYEAYGRFQEAMADERRKTIDDDFLEALLAVMPGMRENLERGIEVLDIGCGRGHIVNRLAFRFPRSYFRGYDIMADAISGAREEADDWHLKNVDYEIGDCASLDEPRAYDLITAFDAIHDLAFPRIVLRNVAHALRDGGMFLMQDIVTTQQPFAPMLWSISTMHCVPVAASQEGEAVGMMWGEELARIMLAEAGLTVIRFERIATDPLNHYCVAVRSSRADGRLPAQSDR